MTEHALTLPDGRSLSYAVYGDPDGRPLIALHGTPGSRLTWRSADAAASAAGVRVIAPERPGLGLSSPKRDLTFASYADDLRALMDALELEQATLTGASGGGGFALAAAARLTQRLTRLVLACALVPGAPTATLVGQAAAIKTALRAARLAPWLAARLLTAQTTREKEQSPKQQEKTLRALPEADRRVVRSEAVAAASAADAKEAVRQGGRAVVHELRLYGRPPGFDLKDITVPVVVMHGQQDANVPIGVARWLVSTLPRAELVELPDAGHLFLFERPEMLLERVV